MRSAAEQQIGIHYEVHALRAGRWLIECAAKEPEQAIREARDILRDAEVQGTRVVKEIWNPSTDTTAARVIFSKLKSESASKRRPTLKAMSLGQKSSAAPLPSPSAAPRTGAAKTKREDGFTAFALLSLISAGVACGGVVWLILG